MKKELLLIAIALVFGTSAFASTYSCVSKQWGKYTVQIANGQKIIKVTHQDYNPDEPVVAKLNPKYKPNNPKWVGSKIYDFGNQPFGEDGSSSFLLSKEILEGKAMGFAQYRNTWDTYTSITMPCNKLPIRVWNRSNQKSFLFVMNKRVGGGVFLPPTFYLPD